MIYLWHLFIAWSVEYPSSALIMDIIIVGCFIAFAVYIFWPESGLKQNRDKRSRKSVPPWYRNLR